MSKSYYCFSRVIFGVRGLHKCRRVGLCMLTVHHKQHCKSSSNKIADLYVEGKKCLAVGGRVGVEGWVR